MNKADIYLRETLLEILEEGQIDRDPRPKWEDGTPAHSKFVTQKVFQYNISKGEFPIATLRPTALKGAWYDIEAIYIKHTNIIEEMHSSIHSWWEDFAVGNMCEIIENKTITYQTIGQTYGHTVKRYDLINKLLISAGTKQHVSSE